MSALSGLEHRRRMLGVLGDKLDAAGVPHRMSEPSGVPVCDLTESDLLLGRVWTFPAREGEWFYRWEKVAPPFREDQVDVLVESIVAQGGRMPRADIDTDVPSIARVYDYLLGGKDNFAVDRATGDAMIEAMPETPLLAQANRGFLREAVRYLVGKAGIRQIVDIGSGLPTAGNVHEIAHEIDPLARVVYVDNDPIVLAHGRELLAGDDTTAVITADLRTPETILDHPDTHRLIDQTEPFAVLLGGILMHLEDEEDPEGVAACIRDRLPSGGYLLVSNTCDTGEPRAGELARAFAEGGMGTRCFRTWDEQRRYFDGLDMVEPGLVANNAWRPGADIPDPDNPAHAMHIGGVGRKP